MTLPRLLLVLLLAGCAEPARPAADGGGCAAWPIHPAPGEIWCGGDGGPRCLEWTLGEDPEDVRCSRWAGDQ